MAVKRGLCKSNKIILAFIFRQITGNIHIGYLPTFSIKI